VEDGGFVGEQLRSVREKWNLDSRNSAIGVIGGLAWQVGGAALFVYATERRVPDLSPENVMLRLADGDLEEVAFVSGRFAAMESDPESPSATVVFENEDGLRDHLREGIEGMVSPVVDHIRDAMRVSKRTMWNRASDLVAQRLLQFGEVAVADKRWCGREAEKLVKFPGSSLDGATGFFVVEHAGREETCMVRGCCCHGYKDPEHGYCDTCPLLSREELEKRAVEAVAG
jgi:ferric iron reductase protein FhuF